MNNYDSVDIDPQLKCIRKKHSTKLNSKKKKIQLINFLIDPNRSEHSFDIQAQKAVEQRTLLASSGRPFHSWNTLLFVL